MLDQWSIVSGDDSDQDISESGFTIIPTSTSRVTTKSRRTQGEAATIDITSPLSASPMKKVVEWWHTSSSVSKIPVVVTAITKPEILSVEEVESLTSIPLGITTTGTKSSESIDVLPQAYTLSVLGPQGSPGTSVRGLFSLGHHPETWPTSLRFGLHPSFRQIHESVDNIYTEAGVEGTLKVILWSKIYDHRSGTLNFWEKMRDAAYEKLNGQSYIVKVVLDEDAKKISKQLCDIFGLGRYRKPVLVGCETYLGINEASDFKWLSGVDGKKLYKQYRASAH